MCNKKCCSLILHFFFLKLEKPHGKELLLVLLRRKLKISVRRTEILANISLRTTTAFPETGDIFNKEKNGNICNFTLRMTKKFKNKMFCSLRAFLTVSLILLDTRNSHSVLNLQVSPAQRVVKGTPKSMDMRKILDKIIVPSLNFVEIVSLSLFIFIFIYLLFYIA